MSPRNKAFLRFCRDFACEGPPLPPKPMPPDYYSAYTCATCGRRYGWAGWHILWHGHSVERDDDSGWRERAMELMVAGRG